MEVTINTTTPDETEDVASKIGERLRGGEVIELISDLGGGKTTFVRGLARGADSSDAVASPTFTVSKVYSATRFEIHHFDFYRLKEAGLIEHELEDLLFEEDVVLILEWSGIVENVLPVERLVIAIQQKGENQRELSFRCPDKFSYLLEDVC